MSGLTALLSPLLRIMRPGLGRLQAYPPRPLPAFAAECLHPVPDLAWPRITIVVPSFNQGRFLDRTLRSIFDQAYPELELIVVDGGSSDDSMAVIERHAAAISWWVSEPDHGQADAINKGFRRSTGELMAWINSDDLVAPGALRTVARRFLADSQLDVLYGNRIVIDEHDCEVGRWILPFHSSRVLRWVDFVPQETLYWRRRAWEAVGARLDDGLHFALDWDFLLRLTSRDVRMAHLPVVLGLFRVHGEQKTSARIVDTGRPEMQSLRARTLGFSPSRTAIIAHVLPFLVAARGCEILAALARAARSLQRTPHAI